MMKGMTVNAALKQIVIPFSFRNSALTVQVMVSKEVDIALYNSKNLGHCPSEFFDYQDFLLHRKYKCNFFFD